MFLQSDFHYKVVIENCDVLCYVEILIVIIILILAHVVIRKITNK